LGQALKLPATDGGTPQTAGNFQACLEFDFSRKCLILLRFQKSGMEFTDFQRKSKGKFYASRRRIEHLTVLIADPNPRSRLRGAGSMMEALDSTRDVRL
jgi:hypothetical protein